ncbi:peptide-N4-asparagine amidase, partial [Kitasatospora aureofaciens]
MRQHDQPARVPQLDGGQRLHQRLTRAPGPPGKGPFRELRLTVDGRVAGAVWPYP